jgi:hypothetical protein
MLVTVDSMVDFLGVERRVENQDHNCILNWLDWRWYIDLCIRLRLVDATSCKDPITRLVDGGLVRSRIIAGIHHVWSSTVHLPC